MATITPANLSYKDKDGDLGEVKSLTDTDVTLLNNALQDIEDLKLAYSPGFVKRDLSNVTAPVQAFKDQSIEWSTPDYSSKIALSYNSFDGAGWIAPSDGIITGGANWADSSKYVAVNGVPVLYSNTETTCIFLRLSKNDVVTTNGAIESVITNIAFYSCKGAN